MNAQMERRKAIADAACRYAEETWVAETSTGVIVIAHPGGDVSHLEDLEYLRSNFGIQSLDCVMRLSQSSEAPVPWSADSEIDRAEAELAEFRAQKAHRDRIDAEVLARAEKRLEQVVAEVSA